MNTKFFAAAALAALLVPSVASAESAFHFDPSAGTNDQQFLDSFFNSNGANAAAAKADAARYADAEQALKASDALIGTHGSTGAAGAKLVTSYNPAAGTNDDQFLSSVVIANPANAAAAKADAERYAAAQQSLNSGAVMGTHGSTGAGFITYFDPSAGTNDDQFPVRPVLTR